MKATYDPKTDTLTFELKSGPVAESDEDKPGVILDYDKDGNLIGYRGSRRLETSCRNKDHAIPGGRVNAGIVGAAV